MYITDGTRMDKIYENLPFPKHAFEYDNAHVNILSGFYNMVK